MFVTLSHYCPTAARLLLLDQDLAIVDAPASLTLDGEVEGLDATGVLPPLLRPGMLMSLDAYDTWEREAVATLNDRRLPPAGAVTAISAATAACSEWRPGRRRPVRHNRGCVRECSRAAVSTRPASRIDHAVKSFLAAHAFASWAAYQQGGLGAAAAAVQNALDAVRAGARQRRGATGTATPTTRSSPRSGRRTFS